MTMVNFNENSVLYQHMFMAFHQWQVYLLLMKSHKNILLIMKKQVYVAIT